jgi:hypothetical protein
MAALYGIDAWAEPSSVQASSRGRVVFHVKQKVTTRNNSKHAMLTYPAVLVASGADHSAG